MLTHLRKIQILAAVNHLSFIIYNIYFFNQAWLLIGIVWAIIVNIVGNNIGLHRYHGHKSFKTNYGFMLDCLSTITCLGSQINYAMVHRHHHAYSDTDKDPQNPKNLSILQSITMDYKKVNIKPTIVSDLVKNERLKYIHKNYFNILSLYILGLLIIDINLFIYCFCLPGIVCWWSAISIGTISHWGGYRDRDIGDRSFNNILASIISMGEGWHHNHHRDPSNYKQGFQWWEFDPAARIISIIKV